MPPRKEPKETVVYPASKRKAPPFKPQRPSKVSRVGSTESESAGARLKATATTGTTKRTGKAIVPSSRRKESIRVEDDEEDEDEESEGVRGRGKARRSVVDPSDSDEELDDNPLAAAAKSRKKNQSGSGNLPTARRKQNSRTTSPPSRRASHASLDPTSTLADASQLDPNTTPAIPQTLLIRLLHERFADSKTKIDKHAVQVLQKYFEVFVKETVAQAKLRKEEDAVATAGNGEEDADASLLEMRDLDKVAAGMLLDFS